MDWPLQDVARDKAQRCFAVASAALLAFGVEAVAAQTGGVTGDDIATRQVIVAAETARTTDLKTLMDATRSVSPAIQRLAVRALGRLETESAVPAIVPLLNSPSVPVRVEAANAIAQALQGREDHNIPRAVSLLKERLVVEKDPAVRGTLYEALGRLPYNAMADVRDTEAVLLGGANEGDRDASLQVQLGTARGYEALYRLQAKKGAPSPESVQRLQRMVRSVKGSSLKTQEYAARVRRLSLAALQYVGAVDRDLLRVALKDTDVLVRTEAASFLEGHGRPIYSETVTKTLLPVLEEAVRMKDTSPLVRYAAIAGYAFFMHDQSCAPLLDSLPDTSDHVALAVIDGLGRGCPADQPRTAEALQQLMAGLPADASPSRRTHRVEWHRAAHAVVALAAIAPDQAAAALPRFTGHPVWQVRAYAARAATALKDAATLRKLAGDPVDNVKSAAIAGLSRVSGHADDDVFIAALTRTDHQVVVSAARALQGSKRKADAVPALIEALNRFTAEGKDNTRDARVAILQRLRELADKQSESDLVPLLSDFDPRIATLATETLTAWTSTPHIATPKRPLASPPVMTEVLKLASSRLRVTMQTGGVFEIRLFPGDTPATVDRVVRLARAGYYNGLTFHRVAPNWVIQGGSPAANEVTGDSPFMVDEVGMRSHLRGSMGISTRGHDTGDAQFFVDLNDNVSLDHGFGVWGEVIRGMGVVDAVLEGDVMQKVEVVRATTKSDAAGLD